MARKGKLQTTAIRIGTAVGKADRTAHKVARATKVARQELVDLMKQVESLRRQLEKSAARLRRLLK
jgi:hypothetical protein